MADECERSDGRNGEYSAHCVGDIFVGFSRYLTDDDYLVVEDSIIGKTFLACNEAISTLDFC